MSAFTASIKNGTNRVVSSAQCSWSSAKPGCFFRFKNDPCLFSVQKVSNFSLFKDFEVVHGKTIKIHDDVGIDFSVGDEFVVLYKEYELITIFEIVNKGSGYKAGDKLKLNSDLPNLDIQTGILEYSVLEVLEVDSAGGILKINISSKGRYLKEPESELTVIGSMGSGAVFKTIFKEMDCKQLIERQIEYIEYNIPCVILLNSPLPKGVSKGKLSLNKWELFLSTNYSRNLVNSEYEIIQDYTSNYKLPLLATNSLSREPIINKSFSMIDEQLKNLQSQIDALKN